jgi:hypothetical protein
VHNRPSEPVQRDDRNRVTFPRNRKQALQAGPVGLRPRHLVGEDAVLRNSGGDQTVDLLI